MDKFRTDDSSKRAGAFRVSAGSEEIAVSYLGRKVLKDDRVKGLRHRCPECGNMMTSTGELYKDAGMSRWSVAFWCPHDQEEFPIWTPALQPLLEMVTQGVDVDALPSI